MSGGVSCQNPGAKGNAKNRASTPTTPLLGWEEGRGVVTPKLRTFLFGIARPFSTFGRIGKLPGHPDLEVGECECGK